MCVCFQVIVCVALFMGLSLTFTLLALLEWVLTISLVSIRVLRYFYFFFMPNIIISESFVVFFFFS